jgi:peptide/nickel transport system permease protein
MGAGRTRASSAPKARKSARATGRLLVATIKPLVQALLVLAIVATAVFALLRLVPGDAAVLILGDQASPEDLAKLRHRLGVDRPLYVQYMHFVQGLLRLDLGDSLRRPGTPAFARVAVAFPPTAALAGTATGIGALVGTALAVACAGPFLGRYRGALGRALDGVAATPLLSFAPVVTYVLCVRLRVLPLPGDGAQPLVGLVFASTLLAIPLSAAVARTGRVALEDIARLPFLSVARAKGRSRLVAFVLHGVPAVSGPLLTVVGAQLGALLGGAVVLERLFERPGLGSLILDAYASRDLPVLEAAIVSAAALFVLAQSLAQSCHALIDPRVRR